MATSSITANFAIKDADEAKRFVAAFLSTGSRKCFWKVSFQVRLGR